MNTLLEVFVALAYSSLEKLSGLPAEAFFDQKAGDDQASGAGGSRGGVGPVMPIREPASENEAGRAARRAA